MTKKILVLGAGGFIGGHLVVLLKKQGHFVTAVDIKRHEYTNIEEIADEFLQEDLRRQEFVDRLLLRHRYDEIYQLAADMGGAGYIFTGENDANVMHNSATINLNVLNAISQLVKPADYPKIFYSSSACIYPAHNQEDPENPRCAESTAYPAAPDSEYGWEKLFSERMYLAHNRNYGIDVRIARFHNIFGPAGSWNNGKEKAPAAICRKVAYAKDGGEIEIWGDGKQTRSFLYIDECLDGVQRLMKSDCIEPVNIGSEEMLSINDFAHMIADIAGKKISLKHIPGPQGVRGRTSDNHMIERKLGWKPSKSLREGLEKTYQWIEAQVKKS